jgi:NADH:ubiquinone oxidoreductase subunit 2 (subunit N)
MAVDSFSESRVMETFTYELIMMLITLLTLSVQTYVIYLVQRVSPRSMEDYKYFLNIFSVGF